MSPEYARFIQATRVHEYTLKELAEHLGFHFSTISVIAKQEAEVKGIRK